MTTAWGRLVIAVSVLQAAGCGSSATATPDAGVEGTAADDAEGAGADGDRVDGETVDSAEDGDDATTDGPKAVAPHVPLLHRASAAACTQPRPAGPTRCPADGGECTRDQDCSAGANGRCTCRNSPALGSDTKECTYDGCASDSDCNGGVCDCRESPAHVTWGTQTVCLGGNCKTDSDCGSGGYCSPSPTMGCGPQSWFAYYCHTPGDECIDDTDCTEANAYCAYEASSSRWVCSTGICQDG